MTTGTAARMRQFGDSRSDSPFEPLSPASARPMPAWWSCLFPALPQRDECDPTPLFPTQANVRAYIAQQSVRLQLLERIRLDLSSSDVSSGAARRKYTRMQLDVALLASIRALAEFASSALELVHGCSASELTQLQSNNLQLLCLQLRVFRALMVIDEPQPRLSAVAAPIAHVSVADRLCAHNAAEVLLDIVERAEEERESAPAGAEDAVLGPLRQILLEGALRTLLALLEHVTARSTLHVSLLQQVYLHIPSRQQTPPVALPRSPAHGSESPMLRLLLSLAERSPLSISSLCLGVLGHVATLPVPNQHCHQICICGRHENAGSSSSGAQPVCTRGDPPRAVVTYPQHQNSTLAVASRLFIFPQNPSLYLVERGLLRLCLDTLQPMLTKPAPHDSAHSHSHSPLVSSPPGRSLLSHHTDDGDDDDGECDDGAVAPLPCSPPVRPLRCPLLSFVHEPHAHADDAERAHHASQQKEERFMGEQYAKPTYLQGAQAVSLLSTAESRDAAAVLKPDQPFVQSLTCGSWNTPHHRSPAAHASNEQVTAALTCLASLATRNAAVSVHLLSQRGMSSFLRSCLEHRSLQLNLRAIALVSSMRGALLYAVLHATSATPLAELSSAALRAPSLARRTSESRAPKSHRRRDSTSSSGSPHIAPVSPSGRGASNSPHTFALAGPIIVPHLALHHIEPPAPRLSPADALKELVPLETRCVRLLMGLVSQQWGGSQARLHKDSSLPLTSTAMQRTALDLLSVLLAQNEDSHSCVAPVPLLVGLARASSTPAFVRSACLRCLVAACSSSSDARARLRAEEALPSLLPLLASSAHVAQTDADSMPHPALLEQQLAAMQLLTALSAQDTAADAFSCPALSKAASTLDGSVEQLAELVVSVLAALESPHAELQLAAAHLLCNLLQPSSPARSLFLQAGVVPKLARLTQAASEWQSPRMASLPDAIDVDICALPPLALQLREACIRTLVALTTRAPAEWRSAVLAEFELEVPGLLALVAPDADEAELASCPASSQSRGVEAQAWLLLSRLMETPTVDGKSDSLAPPTLSVRQVALVLDTVSARVLSAPAEAPAAEVVQLLAAAAGRSDAASKALICSRPPLLHALHAALSQRDESARWASVCVSNLLAPCVAPNSKDAVAAGSPSHPSAACAQVLLQAELFPRLLEAAKLVAPAVWQPAVTATPPTEAVSPSSPSPEQCLLRMHEALATDAAALHTERGVLLEQFATARKAAAAAAEIDRRATRRSSTHRSHSARRRSRADSELDLDAAAPRASSVGDVMVDSHAGFSFARGSHSISSSRSADSDSASSSSLDSDDDDVDNTGIEEVFDDDVDAASLVDDLAPAREQTRHAIPLERIFRMIMGDFGEPLPDSQSRGDDAARMARSANGAAALHQRRHVLGDLERRLQVRDTRRVRGRRSPQTRTSLSSPRAIVVACVCLPHTLQQRVSSTSAAVARIQQQASQAWSRAAADNADR